jgi:hypothetical protein
LLKTEENAEVKICDFLDSMPVNETTGEALTDVNFTETEITWNSYRKYKVVQI